MEPISLIAAQEAGFELRSYAPYGEPNQLRGYIDFIAEMGESIISLFFRDAKAGERLYAARDSYEEIVGGSENTTVLIPYLQRNDLCDISVVFCNPMFRVHKMSLIQQAPICAWREQCDQRSPLRIQKLKTWGAIAGSGKHN